MIIVGCVDSACVRSRRVRVVEALRASADVIFPAHFTLSTARIQPALASARLAPWHENRPGLSVCVCVYRSRSVAVLCSLTPLSSLSLSLLSPLSSLSLSLSLYLSLSLSLSLSLLSLSISISLSALSLSFGACVTITECSHLLHYCCIYMHLFSYFINCNVAFKCKNICSKLWDLNKTDMLFHI